MKYITGESRNQATVLPDCIEDYVGEDNPVRVIDAFVDQLDMGKEGFNRFQPNETGRPPYDPRDLLKLYIYGYFNKIRSSRKLMQECTRNVEVMNPCNEHEFPKMPSDVKLPNNFKKKSDKKVLIRMRRSSEMATKRMCLSEHPFGTVKWYNLGHYVLCRGIEKVTAELGLGFLAYNLRRAINMKGVQEIIAEM